MEIAIREVQLANLQLVAAAFRRIGCLVLDADLDLSCDARLAKTMIA
jgi:hypothetical protein